MNKQTIMPTKKRVPAPKFKVYELDFGDTKLLDEDINVITDWINADASGMNKEGEEYESTITIRYMTRRQINALPEWS